MKVNKHFLSKIIKEEIKNTLYDEGDRANALKRIKQMKSAAHRGAEDIVARKLVDLFVNYRNYLTKNPTDNKSVDIDLSKEIKKISPGLSVTDALDMLEGKIDRQLFSFMVDALKRDKRMTGFSDKLDSYEASISPEQQNVYQVYNKQDPDPGFMRVPKDDEAYDQEDVNRDRKTLTKA